MMLMVYSWSDLFTGFKSNPLLPPQGSTPGSKGVVELEDEKLAASEALERKQKDALEVQRLQKAEDDRVANLVAMKAGEKKREEALSTRREGGDFHLTPICFLLGGGREETCKEECWS